MVSKKERALATGIFNAGTNIGAVIAPILVPFILGAYGWQEAFVITGALGFIWLIFWIIFYEVPAKQKRLSRSEYDYIHSDEAEVDTGGKVSWMKLFGTGKPGLSSQENSSQTPSGGSSCSGYLISLVAHSS